MKAKQCCVLTSAESRAKFCPVNIYLISWWHWLLPFYRAGFFIGGCLFAISFIGVIVCVGILFFVWFLLPVLVKKSA